MLSAAASDNRPPSVTLTRRQGEAQHVARIRVACRDAADNRTNGHILIDREALIADRWCFVDIVDADGEGLNDAFAQFVGCPHSDAVARRILEVQQLAIRHAQLIADDDKSAAGAILQCEGMGIADVRIDGGKRADKRVVGAVLID